MLTIGAQKCLGPALGEELLGLADGGIGLPGPTFLLWLPGRKPPRPAHRRAERDLLDQRIPAALVEDEVLQQIGEARLPDAVVDDARAMLKIRLSKPIDDADVTKRRRLQGVGGAPKAASVG